MKTLVVDDEPVARKLLQHMLKPYGPCHLAEDGAQAVEAFDRAQKEGAPYDLVCMDIQMPRMDGHSALSAIREMDLRVFVDGGAKIIMVTAMTDGGNMESAFLNGCGAYLAKPVRKENLLRQLRGLKLI